MPRSSMAPDAAAASVLHVRLDGPRTGAENMAADRQLLDEARPVVRLYGWRPACVSLGYTQRPEDAVDLAAVAELGLDTVERPTGGGAILHEASELTYAIVLPTGWPGLPTDLFASYRHMAEGVRLALRSLGLDAQYREARGGRDAFCYLREAGVAIAVNGRKISGGAQRRTARAVLQHGTILVRHDAALAARVFRRSEDEIARGVTSLAGEGVDIARDALVRRVAEAYRTHLEPAR